MDNQGYNPLVAIQSALSGQITPTGVNCYVNFTVANWRSFIDINIA